MYAHIFNIWIWIGLVVVVPFILFRRSINAYPQFFFREEANQCPISVNVYVAHGNHYSVVLYTTSVPSKRLSEHAARIPGRFFFRLFVRFIRPMSFFFVFCFGFVFNVFHRHHHHHRWSWWCGWCIILLLTYIGGKLPGCCGNTKEKKA